MIFDEFRPNLHCGGHHVDQRRPIDLASDKHPNLTDLHLSLKLASPSAMSENVYERPLELIDTSHSYFLKQPSNPDLPPISLILRGVNLSSTSKFPSWTTPRPYAHNAELTRTERDELREWDAGVQTQIANAETFWGEAEKGGHDGWFVGHPLQEDGMDVSDNRGCRRYS